MLDDLEVTGTPVFLYDSDRQLARIRPSLPTLGSDIPALAGFAETLGGLLFGDPDALRPDQQALILRTSGETGPQNLP